MNMAMDMIMGIMMMMNVFLIDLHYSLLICVKTAMVYDWLIPSTITEEVAVGPWLLKIEKIHVILKLHINIL